MAIFPQIRELPEKFHTVQMIRSVELKLKLAERISNILTLLKFFDSFEPTKEAVTKVNCFFTYLVRTGQSPELINRRAKWLLEYARAIELYLRKVKDDIVAAKTVGLILPDHPLVILLKKIEEAYLIGASSDFINRTALWCVLNDTLTLASFTKVNQLNIDYVNLRQMIEFFHQDVSLMNHHLARSQIGYEQDFLYRLRHIHYLIKEYVFTQ